MATNILNKAGFGEQLNEALPLSFEKENIPVTPQLKTLTLAKEKLVFGQTNQSVVTQYDVRNLSKKIQKEMDKYQSEKFPDLYSLYANAFKSDCIEDKFGGMVIGGAALRSEPHGLANFGMTCSDSPMLRAKAMAGVTLPSSGAILCDPDWTVLKNDVFMLGGIHATKTYYVNLPDGEVTDDMFWNVADARPRVFSRELMMLSVSGYRQIASESQMRNYGAVLECIDRTAARNATLRNLIDVVESGYQIDDVKKVLAPRC